MKECFSTKEGCDLVMANGKKCHEKGCDSIKECYECVEGPIPPVPVLTNKEKKWQAKAKELKAMIFCDCEGCKKGDCCEKAMKAKKEGEDMEKFKAKCEKMKKKAFC